MFRLLLGVIGLAGILAGLPLLFAGGSLLWVDTMMTDPDGFINSPTMQIEVDGFALVAGPTQIEGLPAIPNSPVALGDIATVRIQAKNVDPQTGIFIGVSPTAAVDQYLAGVPYAVVEDASEDDLFLSYRMNESSTAISLPTEQTFWTASIAGDGPQELEWVLEEGDVSFVIMNADASDGLATEVVLGTRIPLIGTVGTGLMVGGGVVLGVGVILLVLAL